MRDAIRSAGRAWPVGLVVGVLALGGWLGAWRTITGAIGGVMLMMWGVASLFGSRRDSSRTG